MNAKKTPTPVKAKKTTTSNQTDGPRKLKPRAYRSFRLEKRIASPNTTPLPSAFRLTTTAFSTIKKHWKVFLGIVLVYGLLNFVLVQGFSMGGDINKVKDSLNQAFSGQWGHVLSGLSVFSYMLTSSGSSATGASGYQFVLVLLASLALIWTLRELYANATAKLRIRDGFYRGATPLVPFTLVLCVVGLQLIPLGLGLVLFSTVISNGVAAGLVEQMLWLIATGLLALLSLYMVTSSVFALYIVTLPDMTPMKALRSARGLVLSRRWVVLRKVLFLPLALFVIGALVMLPIIWFIAPAAPWIFFVLSMAALAVMHSYMYALYRSLL